jgi:hypothetical protein
MRTIQFDVSAIQKAGQEMAERALEKMKVWGRCRGWKPDMPLKYQNFSGSLVSDTLTLTDVRGCEKKVEVLILLRGASSRPHSAMAGGRYTGLREGEGLIEIFYNSEGTLNKFQGSRDKIRAYTAKYLIHEVAHAVDMPEGMEYLDYNMYGFSLYFNQPSEFRAYTKTIIHRILERPLPKILSAETIEELLESYSELVAPFNARNQKRLRQMLVREIQDSGRTIEGVDRDVHLPGSAP